MMDTDDKQENFLLEPKDSIILAADKLVSAANRILNSAKTEEDLKIGFEKCLEPICQNLGIRSQPQYEKSLFEGKRSDAVHGRVIIEYEKPKAFRNRNQVEHAFDQLFDYIYAETKASEDRLFFFEPKYSGVGFDGEQIFFVQFTGDKNKPKAKLDKKDFIIVGPFPFDARSSRTFLTLLRSLSRKLLTAENLAEVFGPASSISREAVSAFNDALKNWGVERVEVFFNEWKRLFGIVYGEQFSGHQQEDAEALLKLYKIDQAGDFQEFLFSVHTFFALLMKLIAAEIITLKESALETSFCSELAHGSDEDFISQLKGIEEGLFYSKRGLTNFLEGDFFSWYLDALSPRLRDAIREVARELGEFEPATAIIEPESTRDLLKKLYQYLVPQQVRHRLGEYYTPDWLAELTLNEVGYSGDIRKRILDPACGSGTFLVLAIQRAKKYASSRNEKPVETAKNILANIWGFDLNPLAVIAARTNYLFAIADMLASFTDIEIPVYLADSVLWPERRGQMRLSPGGDSIEIYTSLDKPFFVPKIWVKNKGFLMRKAAPLTEQMVKQQYSASEAMHRFKENGLAFPPHEEIIENFFNEISEIERKGKNGIWARFLKNVFAPMMAGNFDFIVGNPPWIRWGYLAEEYRHATLPLWENYGLFSLKGHAARLGGGEKDFSMLFTYAVIDNYLKKKGKLGFLITQEVFKSKGAGEGFRRFQLGEKEYLKVLKAHDLVTVQPFEKAANKTAMIILKKGEKTTYPLPYTIWTRKKKVGKIPTDMGYKSALKLLKKEQLSARPVYPPHGSWQTIKKSEEELLGIYGDNHYKARRGASTEPYGVFWITVHQVLSNGNILIRNRHDRGKKKVQKVQEAVEPDLVYPMVSGADIDRWSAIPQNYLLMTQNPEKREPYPEEYLKTKLPRTYGYLTNFKEILLSRGSKTVRQFAERTAFYAMYGIGDYTVARYKVVWKRMANDIHAAVISQFKPPFGYKTIIPSDTTSFFPVDNENEAHYLCAVINSAPVRDFIKSYSSAGRGFGTPSVMKHIGIPKFDKNNKLHSKLTETSKKCHRLKAEGKNMEVEKTEKENDRLVKKLFGISS